VALIDLLGAERDVVRDGGHATPGSGRSERRLQPGLKAMSCAQIARMAAMLVEPLSGSPAGQPIHVILDPVSSHRSAEVHAWLAAQFTTHLRVPLPASARVLAVVYRGLVLSFIGRLQLNARRARPGARGASVAQNVDERPGTGGDSARVAAAARSGQTPG
jgi:hypothetical protein